MFHKLLRTIIGLPFVLALWPFVLALMLILLIPAIILVAIEYSVDGHVNDSDDIIQNIIVGLTLPYQLIKKVWGL